MVTRGIQDEYGNFYDMDVFDRVSKALDIMGAAVSFIAHGAELDNVLPEISTMEQFFDNEFDRIQVHCPSGER